MKQKSIPAQIKAKRTIRVSELFAGPVREFSIYNNKRMIPSVVDGFKPSQRKVIYGTLKKSPSIDREKGIKVAQLANYIAECLHPDTLINVNGLLIRVEDLYQQESETLINGGFFIENFNEESNSADLDFCKAVIQSKEASEFIQIEVEDGETISVTPDHELLTTNGWKKAKDLSKSDKLVSSR